MRYPLNQPVRLTAAITDNTVSPAVPTDAGSLQLVLTRPDGTAQTYTSAIVHDSTGNYHLDLQATDLSQLGHYQYVWTSTGTGASVQVGELDVYDPNEVELLSVDDAKRQIKVPLTNTTFDDDIRATMALIPPIIEDLTGGPIITRTITNERQPVTGYYTTFILRYRPVVAVQSIVDVASGVSLTITDLDIDTNSNIIRRKLQLPFLSWGPFYNITYTAGWGTTVAPGFNKAAKLIFKALWTAERGASSMLVRVGGGAFASGVNQMGGTETVAAPNDDFAIPQLAMQALRPYLQEVYV